MAVRHQAVPITLAHDVLTAALADPTNVLALDDIRLATKLSSVRTAVATASDVQEAVNRYYGGTGSGGGVSDTFGALADVEVDVVELLAALRTEAGGEPAVLVATGPEDQQARDRALAAGAPGSVTKPFAEAELRAEVAAALGRRAALTTSH